MADADPRLKPGDRVRIQTSDSRSAFVNGRRGRVMDQEPRRIEGVWAYWIDLFPPLERTWLLREDELEQVDD